MRYILAIGFGILLTATLAFAASKMVDESEWYQLTSGGATALHSHSGTGITTLNTLTGATQTFTDIDDTNVTLTITSSGTNHEFALGYTGTLSVLRGGWGNDGTATTTRAGGLAISTLGISSANGIVSSAGDLILTGGKIVSTGAGTSTFSGGLSAAGLSISDAAYANCTALETRNNVVMCATDDAGGGATKVTYTFIADRDAAGFVCTNCPVAGTEFFPIVITNFNGTNNVRVVAFCDDKCNANTVVEIINDADNSVIASVSGPNDVDIAEAGASTAESLTGDINAKVRIKGSGAAADDYAITNVYLEFNP